jgi:hypothetical protein
VAGAVAGAAIAWAVGANAESNPAALQLAQPYAASSSAPSGGAVPPYPGRPGGPDGDHGLDLTGTVKAVGSTSVTIKTGSGAKTYRVTSNSDIDKNGEAKLSDLKAGDAVRFDTDTVNGATVIDHLHAGSEALDRPTG